MTPSVPGIGTETSPLRIAARRLVRLPRFAGSVAKSLRPSAIPFLRQWLRISRSVRGWLRMPDGHLLYTLAANGPGRGEIIEIGSAWGRSTVCLALGARQAGRERVIAIDPHTGDDWYLHENRLEGTSSFAEFSRNIHAFDVNDWVEPMVMTSEAAAIERDPAPVRLLFIDGLHTYEGVKFDIETWVHRLVPGGVVVFDDYDNTDAGVGVGKAVDELLASGLVEPRLWRRFNLVWTYRR